MILTDQLIFKNIAKHISLIDSEIQYLWSLMKKISLDKKEYILSQGKICNKIYFVDQGSLRAYNVNENGKESTIMFAVSDWWITAIDSFMNQKASSLTIVALENSTILELDYDNLQTLLLKIPKFERFFRILFQNAYIREQRRALHNISMSTEERYVQFIKKYPAIVEKITQKQIASYLGVTPEFLSALKNNADS